MRVIAGKLKGTTLFLPRKKTTRPLKDLVRESIFNLLDHSNKFAFQLKGSNILDLYSGSGSFGIECLSRQASNVTFVEKEIETVKILKKNITKLKLINKSEIFINEVLKLIKRGNISNKKFNLIFCDPPFKYENIKSLIELIFKKKLLKKNGIIILHRNKNFEELFPDYFKIAEERTYGISKIIFGNFLS